jgi:tRNA dimethylallyltransferase
MQTGKSIEEWQKNTKPSISKISYQKLLINIDREILYSKAENRFDQMLIDGAIEEVECLNSLNYSKDNTIMKAIGVREISDYISGKIELNEAIKLAKQKTRNYIKRQQTWINSNNITWNTSYKKLVESL